MKKSSQNIKWLYHKLITFNGTVDSVENHSSADMIKGYYKDVLSFKFKEFVANESLKVMKELSSNKVSVLKKTPIKIIKN